MKAFTRKSNRNSDHCELSPMPNANHRRIEFSDYFELVVRIVRSSLISHVCSANQIREISFEFLFFSDVFWLGFVNAWHDIDRTVEEDTSRSAQAPALFVVTSRIRQDYGFFPKRTSGRRVFLEVMDRVLDASERISMREYGGLHRASSLDDALPEIAKLNADYILGRIDIVCANGGFFVRTPMLPANLLRQWIRGKPRDQLARKLKLLFDQPRYAAAEAYGQELEVIPWDIDEEEWWLKRYLCSN